MTLQKFEYLRSEKHLDVIRNMRCWQCGSKPAQAAHSNQSKHGKGHEFFEQLRRGIA